MLYVICVVVSHSFSRILLASAFICIVVQPTLGLSCLSAQVVSEKQQEAAPVQANIKPTATDSIKAAASLRQALKHGKWPNPQVALVASFIIPGAGQVYNRSYWKVPIVYGYLITMGTVVLWNHNEFARTDALFKDKYRYETDSTYRNSVSDPFPNASSASLNNVRIQYRAQRDNFAFFFLVGYILQAMEAYVGAHLKHFNVSDDLALSVQPYILPPTANNPNVSSGARLTLHLGR